MQNMSAHICSLVRITSAGALVSISVPLTMSLLATAALSENLNQMLPDNIQAAGEITVASDTNFPPYEYVPEGSDTPVGLDIDIAGALGKTLGVRVKFVSTAFDGIIPALKSGRYDIGISAIIDTEDREKVVDMVGYLVNPGSSSVVLSGNPKNIHQDKDLCGKTVSVLSGSTQEKALQKRSGKCTEDGNPAIKILPFPEASSTYLALQSGQSDAVLTGSIGAAYQVKLSKGSMESIDMLSTKQTTAIAVSKGNDKLVAALKAGLDQMREDGSYASILEKWGSSKYALEEFSINAAGSSTK